jgi:hypothetical protein
MNTKSIMAKTEMMSSSAVGCRGIDGAYTRVEGPHHASVEEGVTKPEMENTSDDRRICKKLVVSG